MTGLEVIVAAVLVGAADTAKNLVGDTYTALKGHLTRKLADRREARAVLEAEETEPGVWRTQLMEGLAGTGIGEDTAAVELAQRVLAVAAPAGKYIVNADHAKAVVIGDGNTQTLNIN